MAKNAKTETTATTTIAPVATLSTEAFGLTFDMATASPEAIAYVVSFGFRQALSDATAGLPKAITAAWDYRNAEGDAAKPYEGYCNVAGLDPDTARSMALGAFIGAVCAGARRARYDRIMSGTMGQRASTGPRPDSGEKLVNTVAREFLVAAAKRANKTLPKGEELAAMLERYRAANIDAIKAEVERRQAVPVAADFNF